MLQQPHKLSLSLSSSRTSPWLHIDVITILTFVVFYATTALDEPRMGHCRTHGPYFCIFTKLREKNVALPSTKYQLIYETERTSVSPLFTFDVFEYSCCTTLWAG